MAELDPASHRIKYITIAPTYQEFESALKQDWLSRRQVFELTTRPLPIVVFVPIILSLLALCIVLGTVGAIFAIRPSLMNTRALIEAAYAPTVDLTANPNLGESGDANQSPLPTVEISTTLTPGAQATDALDESKATPTVLLVIETQTPVATEDPALVTATPSPVGNAPATPDQSLLQTATPTPLPPTNTPVPTTSTRVIGVTPGLNSPLPTPTPAAGASTFTPTPTDPAGVAQTPTASPTIIAVTAPPTQVGAATSTATSTATATPAPTETVYFSGTFPSGTVGRSVLLSNFIAIADVRVVGDASFNEGNEYIDLKNTSDSQTVSMIRWKIRINRGQSFFIPNEVASASFSIPPLQGCRIYTGSLNTQDIPAPYNWCGSQSLGTLPAATGVYTNDHGTIEILDESGKTVATFTY